MLPHAKLLDNRQGIIQRVGIGAVRLQGEACLLYTSQKNVSLIKNSGKISFSTVCNSLFVKKIIY